jgi:uncharacterized membrane protein
LPLVAVAAIALSQALLLFHRWPLPVLCLSLAMGATVLAVLTPAAWPAGVNAHARRATLVIVGVGCLVQLFDVAVARPGLYFDPSRADRVRLVVAAAAAAVVIAAELAGTLRLARWRLPVLIAIQLALGIWIVRASPDPFIDVFTVHLEALRALGQGLDPYGRTFPNIYNHDHFYGPGLVVNGRVQFGFPYPPLSLLMAAPGQFLGGDFRFGNAVAVALAALLIGTCRRERLAVGAAALFLFTPRGLFVVEQGWTEPYVVLLFAATVWCACRAPALMPFALGLFFAVKQYAILAAPLVVLLHAGAGAWRKTGRTVLQAALVAAVVTVPFVVAGPAAFVHDVLMLQIAQPFRPDSLSYLAEWAGLTGRTPWTWLAFVVTPVVLVLCVRWAPRNVAGFAGAVALTTLVFFAFNKQAFVNYYFFVVGALCCALAAAAAEPEAV